MIEGAYGTIIFGRALGRIATFDEIKRHYERRFETHMVHLQKPLLEDAGSDLIKIELHMSLNASWCGDPNAILAQWHYYHENALAAPLIIGGKPMGPLLSLFVITELQEMHRYWLTGGQLIGAEVSVSFKEYIAFVDSTGTLSALGALGVPGFGG